MQTTTLDKQTILKMLLDNAEEPDDIFDGTGTFTTFRTEYFITDIQKLIDQAVQIAKQEEADLKKQCWSGMVLLRDILIKEGFEKPTVRGRDIQEIIDELTDTNKTKT